MPSHINHYEKGCKRGTHPTFVVKGVQTYTGENLSTFMKAAYKCPACLKLAEKEAVAHDKAQLL